MAFADEALDAIGRAFELGQRPARERDGERGALPEVLVVDLGDGRPEPSVELRLERRDLLALALEVPHVVEVEMDEEEGYVRAQRATSSRSTDRVA